MVALIFFVLSLVASPFKPKSRLEAENAALRHQVMVLQRKVRGRVHFTNGDRLFFIQLYRWCPSVLKAMIILRPETVVRWHRAGLRRYWRWKSRSQGGRPQIAAELRALMADERGQSALGCTTHSWRTAQARLCGGAVERRQVQGQERRSVWSELGHVSAQSCAAYGGHGFVRGSDHRLYPALRSGHCPAGSAGACLVRCNRAPDGRMDRAATDGSFPLE